MIRKYVSTPPSRNYKTTPQCWYQCLSRIYTSLIATVAMNTQAHVHARNSPDDPPDVYKQCHYKSHYNRDVRKSCFTSFLRPRNSIIRMHVARYSKADLIARMPVNFKNCFCFRPLHLPPPLLSPSARSTVSLSSACIQRIA